MQEFRTWAWVGSAAILCLAGAGGYWLSKRTLRPVQQLVLSTKGISEQNLSHRVPLPAANDELRELATTMNAMLARLESAFARVTQFTADASHELRTPVTVIRTTAEVLLEKQRPPEEMRAMATDILREAEFTSGLIEQLLLLARADTTETASPLIGLDLAELVTELDPIGRKLAESHGVSWHTYVAASPILVMGDRPLVRRLLLILIDNACRYTSSGGDASLRLTTMGQNALVEVTDTGIGIPAVECERIFDRFYRAANARYFHADGTGLGLSIARWIATVHQGTLQVSSVVDKGTTFTLLIPAAAPHS